MSHQIEQVFNLLIAIGLIMAIVILAPQVMG